MIITGDVIYVKWERKAPCYEMVCVLSQTEKALYVAAPGERPAWVPKSGFVRDLLADWACRLTVRSWFRRQMTARQQNALGW